MEASTPAPFRVVNQSHTVGLRPDGTLGGTWTVTAEAGGVTFSVDVPDESYNAPTVHQLLFERAATIAAVSQLGTTPPQPPTAD